MLLNRTKLHPETYAGIPGVKVLLTLLLLAAAIAATSQLAGRSASAQQPVATYEEEILSGRNFMRQRKYEDALKAFKRANDLKGKTSAEAYLLMADAYMGLDAYKNVAQSADKVIEFAGDNVGLQAQAYNLKAIALQRQSDGGKDQKKLQEAEAVFRQALTVKADYAEARYNLAIVVLQQNRDPEGVAELKKYLEMGPNQIYAADAQKIIENPRRAREPFAPDFSVTTSAGEYISLDDLKGKVVLLDFWATWCGPCVTSLPALRNLNKRFTKSEKFVLLGISVDGDEDKWSNFIVKQEMVWPQFLDRQRKVQSVFKVNRFPTYIVLDHEGVIRYRTSGASFEKEAELSFAIEKQIKALQKAAAGK